MLGGGGLVVANVYASATDGGSGGANSTLANEAGAGTAATIDCPDVGEKLTEVPDDARADVDKELALLDQQVTEAYQQLQKSAGAAQDGDFDADAIMTPLQEQRTGTIERIAAAIDRTGERPQGLEDLAACTLRPTGDQGGDGADAGQGENGGSQDGENQDDEGQTGNGGQAGNGPVAADYADITTVQPNVQKPPQQKSASRGTFTTSCGVNEQGLFNSDNVIVAPGVTNGAHHFHDYIGNQANDAFASDQDLANAETSCENPGDKSSYYWPVLRLQNGTVEQDAEAPGGGIEGNAGEIVTPAQVTLTFVGSPVGEVTAMPRLLRIITGDAKAFVNGTANANASWSCTGFEDRQLKDKYPLCPSGSDVVRTFKFQSCWDGRNIDSANHRTHVAFADAAGQCPAGFQAIPQLVQRIVYDVDAPSLNDGGRTTPLFAVDSFPEQLHKPVTDHGDFINVFDEDLMGEMVDCINGGRQCDSGDADPGSGADPDEGAGEQPTATPEEPQDGNPGEQPDDGNGGEQPGDDGADQPGDKGNEPSAEPSNGAGGADPTPAAPAETAPVSGAPNVYASPSATSRPSDTGAQDDSDAAAAEVPQEEESGSGPSASGQTEPQAVQGGLADTGARLWPAAAGAVLLIAGFVLLRRTARRSL
ncbi:DUF1996 domain-containing protein [Streptomyces sp. PSKA30]|uniref:DUF1996 domain-containing protein n=1 Tax=Streptomyces sp. PSKA30 TaxID=2874597 RepID=UPI001CD0E906|nr:DUF1996 domain-containing protein [Streptomyces sp. PSKA30]MBZ9639404.1 DUF1996 domain-containing protein [Streptomyces sp. PSKA30]